MLFPEVGEKIRAFYGRILIEGRVLEVTVPEGSQPGPNDILKIEEEFGHVEYWVRHTLTIALEGET